MKNIFKSKTSLFLFSATASLGILLSLALFFYITQDKPVVVLDMTTMSQDEVLLWASEHELSIETIEVYDDFIATGSIMSQDTSVDSTVLAGQSIVITVSKGPNPDVLIDVEDFTGKDIAAIQTFIDTSKLMNASILFEKSDKVKTSFLIEQSVTGQQIKRSDEITFTISTGTRESLDKITVPDFATLSKSEITQWGSSNNIKMNFIEEFNAAERGKVFEQSVLADAFVYDGSSITVKFSRGPGVVLDNLVGQSKADIDRFITSKKLKITYSYTYSSAKVKDFALSMTPKATTRVEEQTTVSIVLSLGKVAVSDYKGKTLANLEAWVNSVNKDGANLKIKSSIIFSDAAPAGTIATQSPASGDIDPGTTITVHISKGSGVTVKAFATKTDTQEGLKISLVEKYSTEAAGTVLSQSIASGTRVDLETPITLTVSLGKVPVTSKIGSTLASLQAWVDSVNAKGANLTLSSSEAYTTNQDEKGKITTQTPSSDSVNPGSTITVVVSKGTQVTIPNLVGTTTTSFTGLVVNKTEQYNSTVASGTVISQNVAADTKVDYGSSIAIVVSKGADPATLPAYLPPLAPMVANNAISFNDTVSRLSAYLSGLGFTNYKFVSGDYSIGSGQVNSQTPGAGSYTKDTEIIIYVQQ